MKGVNIHNLEIEIKVHIDINIVDIGSLTLSVDDREYILDVTQSYSDKTENFSGKPILRITSDLETDKELFSDCPYNLTKNDLLDSDHNGLNAELYISGEEHFEVEKILLHFDIDGRHYQIKVKEDTCK